MSSSTASPRVGGIATIVAGLTIVVLGIQSMIDPDAGGAAWMIAAAVAAGLFVLGLLALRSRVMAIPLARRALVPTAVAFVLFALAHLYALVDEDLATELFSVFQLLGAVGLIVAGVSIVRHAQGPGWARAATPVCGGWAFVVPVGAILGDTVLFGAIAAWGVCWIGLGLALQTSLGAPGATAPSTPGCRVADQV